MVSLGCMVMEKLTYSQKLDIVNILIAGKAKPMSLLVAGETKTHQNQNFNNQTLLYHSHDLYMLLMNYMKLKMIFVITYQICSSFNFLHDHIYFESSKVVKFVLYQLCTVLLKYKYTM